MTASTQPSSGAPVRPAAGGPPDAATPGGGAGTRQATLSFDMFYDTNPGKARGGHNEDAIWAAPATHAASAARGYLFVVADGMGGHNAGEVASQNAVRAVYERFYADSEPDIHRSLDRAIRQTNNELYNQSQSNPAQHGMGTTMTAAVLKGNKLHVAHVGDSRLYLIRNGQPEQVTHDHSWVEEQVRAGVLTRLQAESHPQRNVITRALATGPDVRVDYEERELQPGDVIVMCSDGLNTEIGDTQIASLATKAVNAQEAVQRLIQLANDNGGEDNISVAVIRIGAPAGVPAAAVAPPKKFPLAAVAGGIAAVALVAVLGAFVLPRLLAQGASEGPVTVTARVTSPVPPTSTPNEPTVAPATEAPAVAPVLPTDNTPAETATPAASATASPFPTVTMTATRRAQSVRTTPTSRPTVPIGPSVPVPVLRDPDGSSVSGGVTFNWELPGYVLGETEGFALLVWKAGADGGSKGLKLPSLFNACKDRQIEKNFSIRDLSSWPGYSGDGEYLWTVIVVDTAITKPGAGSQCQEISEQPEAHRFTYSKAGGAPAPQVSPTPSSGQ